jgi:hemerythrin-like domain-containing protein
MINKREFLRYDATNLVDYTLRKGNGDECGQGAAKTLNIGRDGMLLEIDRLLDDEVKTIELELALANVIVHIKGRVVFKRVTKNDRMEVGIQFVDVTDEITKKLSEYIVVFFDETGKPKNLIRERVSRIDNVVLTLSREHKIINDYVIACRKMLEVPENDLRVQDLDTLFDLMERDLNRHFQFEEKIIFEAVLSGAENRAMTETVRDLQREHGEIMELLNGLMSELKSLLRDQQSNGGDSIDNTVAGGLSVQTGFNSLRENIDSFMEMMKKHSRNEIENIFPAIDSDQEKMAFLNDLLSKYNLL